MSDLSEWFQAIEESGGLQREKDDATRSKFLEAPHEIHIRGENKVGIWPGIDCVVIIPFFSGENGKLNVHGIQYFPFDLVKKMNQVMAILGGQNGEDSSEKINES